MIERKLGENTTFETRSESNNSVDKKKRYAPNSDRNLSSPRLTEMLQDGRVDVIGKKKCEYTHKMVTLFKVIA